MLPASILAGDCQSFTSRAIFINGCAALAIDFGLGRICLRYNRDFRSNTHVLVDNQRIGMPDDLVSRSKEIAVTDAGSEIKLAIV